MNPIDRLFMILRQQGQADYGETAVSQYEHALQCAVAAERAGASPMLIASALLHDIGHLTNAADRDATRRGEDAGHERIGAALLAQWFGDKVAAPVRLHVAAKRYLTAVEPGYRERLSASSEMSLMVQGGPFDAEATQRFIALPLAADAVRLRRWDEGAKLAGAPIPDLEHFRPFLERCLQRR
jgi:gamma-butyrobetaine dioxygenase